jgi:hypothetical protein
MTEHDTDTPNSKRTPTDHYEYVEYEAADGSVSVIQDTRNEDAWIRATRAVAVEH